MSEKYDICVFTKIQRELADEIIDKFDFWKVVKRRFYEDSCEIVDKHLSKNLKAVCGNKCKNTILIDIHDQLAEPAQNVMRFAPWTDNLRKDTELKKLVDFFTASKEKIVFAKDLVRLWDEARAKQFRGQIDHEKSTRDSPIEK